ncbi:MAG: hypothetical protein ACOCXW_01305 [Bacteroidota bacterium]
MKLGMIMIVSWLSFILHANGTGAESFTTVDNIHSSTSNHTGTKCLPNDSVTAFRFRSDFNAKIDANTGWAAGINKVIKQSVDQPFRVRFEIESDSSIYRRQYSLQYKWNDGPWSYAEAHEFPYPSMETPPLSIVGCDAYFYGEEAGNLIPNSKLPANRGAGVSLAPTTPGWVPHPANGASAEWEWALVVRHWADGPSVIKDGDTFSIRMVDHKGLPLPGIKPEFKVSVPSYHLGGTFVETPARIGSFEDRLGHLYFIMEPTETNNCFMMLKSMDHGKSWIEVDPDNRPRANDLEGVGAVMSSEGIIHLVHQKSEEVYYHAFATADNGEFANQWITDSELITDKEKPPVQTADIALRPDGSIVVVYGVGTNLQARIREADGNWLKPFPLDATITIGLTSPSLICRTDGIVDIAYKSADGKGWIRQLLPDNTFTSPQIFADNLGTTEYESIAILPLVYLSDPGTTVIAFRRSDGYLYVCRRLSNNNWSEPFRISDRPVITNAVDSDQAGADIVSFEGKIYVSFISQDTREIYLSVITDFEKTPNATKVVSDIQGSWVRGQILMHQPDSPCYGIIYDAGSKGGSGFNRYISLPLEK